MATAARAAGPISDARTHRGGRWRTRLRWGTIALIGIVVLLVAARAALPIVVQRYVNQRLDAIPDFEGSIGDVDLHLWRGAYSVREVRLLKKNGRVPLPFFSSPRVQFTIDWRALIQGKVVGAIYFQQPALNIVNGKAEADSQTSIDPEWLHAIKDLYPFRINRFEVYGGEIHYRDFERQPRVDVRMNDVGIVASNFSNTRRPSEGLEANIEANGMVQGRAPFKARAKIAPASSKPTFGFEGSLRELPVSSLNDFLRAYAGVTAEGGTMSVDLEVQSEQGRFRGYVKPLLKDLEVLKIEKDIKEGPLHVLWEGLVAAIAEIFTNQRHDQLGTRAPFAGNFDDPKVATWSALTSAVRNAFVRALKTGTEDDLPLAPGNVDKAKDKEKS